MKPLNQKAWWLVLPVFLCVAFSAVLPLMTVVNYSVQDIISPERRVFVGTEWFVQVMRDEELHAALLRQLTFSLAVLLVEIPLGIALALSMPATGWKASATLVIVALSLLIPWNVVGTIWQIYGRADIGLLGATLQRLGIELEHIVAGNEGFIKFKARHTGKRPNKVRAALVRKTFVAMYYMLKNGEVYRDYDERIYRRKARDFEKLVSKVA